MTQLRFEERPTTAGNVRVVTVEEAIAEARRDLDDYEQRYGVASERLAQAFTDAGGNLVETGAYLRWTATLERWRQLTATRSVG